MDYIEECREKGFNNFQIHEVELGFKHGLNGDQIDLYADVGYDHLQMQEIRLGLENGLTQKQIQFFARKEFGWQEMNHIRTNIKNENLVDEHKAADLHGKRIKNTGLLVTVVLLFIAVAAGGYIFCQYWLQSSQELNLQLISNDVAVEYGTDFHSISYIQDRTSGNDIELSVPDNVDTHKLGTYAAKYTLKNKYKSIDSILNVTVVDTEAPVLKLTETTAVKYRTDDFACKTFISSAIDNVDGDITSKVTCGDIDKTLDQQTVKYIVTDSSGNKAEAALTLNLSDPPAPEKEIIYVPGNSTSSSGGTGSGTSGGSASSGSQTRHGTEYFNFSDGYNIDSGFAACKVLMESVGHGSCIPIQNSSGIYTGYKYSD
jgi:uncharacterized membrane protein YgcG